MATPAKPDLPIKHFRTAAAFRKWLGAHPEAPGAWLMLAKKGHADAVSVSYAEAVDIALCFGWIDGQSKSLDERFHLQRFTPRRPKSLWSKINVGHVARLSAAGSMAPGGLREVEAAKADGRWAAAYDSPATMPVPDELAAALGGNRKARECFEQLDRTNRFAVCWRVQTAKTPATRAARIDRLVAMLARGEKLHP